VNGSRHRAIPVLLPGDEHVDGNDIPVVQIATRSRGLASGGDVGDSIQQQAASVDDGNVARREVLLGAVNDRAHTRLGNRVLLQKVADEAAEVSVFHSLAVLAVV